jgi:hypothetical protein
MADRPPPEAPQVRCAHAPSLDGLRTLQVVRIRQVVQRPGVRIATRPFKWWWRAGPLDEICQGFGRKNLFVLMTVWWPSVSA